MAINNLSGNLVQKITLDELRFFAYHGYYPEEQVNGNEFYVAVSVSFPLAEFRKEEDQDDLAKTIDYEALYGIVSAEMDTPRKLLETVCQHILKKTLAEFSFVESVDITIRKTKLPFGDDQVKALVSLHWHR